MTQITRLARWGAILFSVLAAGCSLTGAGDSAALTVASLGTEPVAPPAAAPVSMGPLLEGGIGSRLTQSDRDQAFQAETAALQSGERRTWRGAKGTYGFVVPGSTAAAQGEGATCRSFTHTIYFGGRPQTGQGKGCQDPDGSWRITG